jgi:hypothetical protein
MSNDEIADEIIISHEWNGGRMAHGPNILMESETFADR